MDADVNAPAAPAVWAPPPRLFVAAWGIGAGLSALWPMPPGGGEGFGGTPAGRGALALALIAAGLALVAWAFQTLRRHDTSPDPRRAASALVTQGPFAWSRNPVYVAMTWIYLGATLAWNAAGPLWTLPVLLAVMDRLVVQREEAHLRARFGSAYEDYARRVRRWI